MPFTKDAILELCRKYGPSLNVPAGLDGAKVLYALAGNESSFGANCGPRHEPAYDEGGHYAGSIAPLLSKYGRAAACSYGPWQVMYSNCADLGTPQQLEEDADLACRASVDFLNRFVLGFRKAQTVEQIAEIYNSGHISSVPAEGVSLYVRNAVHYYNNAPN